MRCKGLFALVWVGLLWVRCIGPAQAWDSPAPDVVVYCTPAMEGALRAASSRYTATSHVAVHIFVSPPDGLVALVRHRARADVVVADAATVAALAAQKSARPESVTVLGKDPFVLIAKAGSERPADATAASLVGSHRTVLPDPTLAASFDGAALLHAALPGLAASDLQGVSDTPDVIAAVAGDGRLLGLVNRTEAHMPGLVEAVRLPIPPASIEGALVAGGQSGQAGAFLLFMAKPEGQAVLHAFGLEIPS